MNKNRIIQTLDTRFSFTFPHKVHQSFTLPSSLSFVAGSPSSVAAGRPSCCHRNPTWPYLGCSPCSSAYRGLTASDYSSQLCLTALCFSYPHVSTYICTPTQTHPQDDITFKSKARFPCLKGLSQSRVGSSAVSEYLHSLQLT